MPPKNKDLTHIIMEAGKFQDLQNELTSWRPRRVDGIVLVQEAPMLQFLSKGKKS